MTERFEDAVAAVLERLGPGEVLTYGEVAAEAGSPGVARAVGHLLSRSGGAYPWWRVVTSTGRLVPGHEVEHARRLESEGVQVVNGRVKPAWAYWAPDLIRDIAREADVSIYDHPVSALDGGAADLHDFEDKVALVVNVASKCGLTPQYAALEKLYEDYRDRGFTVLGFPCNQFLGQEPGTPEEIATFCSDSYGVTFPLFAKIDVNGDARDAFYAELEQTADDSGHSGDIRWNFEKFLIAPGGKVVARFSPQTLPDAPEVIAAIEASLPA